MGSILPDAELVPVSVLHTAASSSQCPAESQGLCWSLLACTVECTSCCSAVTATAAVRLLRLWCCEMDTELSLLGDTLVLGEVPST